MVRRILALLVQLAISSSLLLSALAAANQSTSLPECCRRTGAHHCAMMDMPAQEAHSGPRIAANCPCIPHYTLALQTACSGPETPQDLVIAWAQHVDPVAQAAAGFRISCERTRQKRGPPSFIFV